jgi:hypothetical protein
MSNRQRLRVSVCFFTPSQRELKTVVLPPGSTVQQALSASGILTMCPEISLTTHKVGIFSRIVKPDTVLENGDRVEIYRPVAKSAAAAARQKRKGQDGTDSSKTVGF